jgi:hypothetical protein
MFLGGIGPGGFDDRWRRRSLNRVQSDMRHFHFAFGFRDVLDLGETRFRIYYFLIL